MKRSAAALTVATLLLVAAAPAAASEIFVSNEKDNTVTVLDIEYARADQDHPVGKRPRGIVISPDHKELFVCSRR